MSTNLIKLNNHKINELNLKNIWAQFLSVLQRRNLILVHILVQDLVPNLHITLHEEYYSKMKIKPIPIRLQNWWNPLNCPRLSPSLTPKQLKTRLEGRSNREKINSESSWNFKNIIESKTLIDQSSFDLYSIQWRYNYFQHLLFLQKGYLPAWRIRCLSWLMFSMNRKFRWRIWCCMFSMEFLMKYPKSDKHVGNLFLDIYQLLKQSGKMLLRKTRRLIKSLYEISYHKTDILIIRW